MNVYVDVSSWTRGLTNAYADVSSGARGVIYAYIDVSSGLEVKLTHMLKYPTGIDAS